MANEEKKFLGYDGTEQLVANVKAYVAENSTFTTDDTLVLENKVLRVNTTNEASADNTRPITSAGVYAQLGNIEVLLQTI